MSSGSPHPAFEAGTQGHQEGPGKGEFPFLLSVSGHAASLNPFCQQLLKKEKKAGFCFLALSQEAQSQGLSAGK